MYKKIKEIDIEEIKVAVKNCTSLRGVIKFLGCNPKNGNEMVILAKTLRDCNVNTDHHNPSFNYTKISEVIEKCYSLVDVAKNIGLVSEKAKKIDARLCKNIKKYINENSLDTSHFRHSSKVGYNVIRTNEEVFSKNSEVSQSTVKKRFIAKVKYECAICSVGSWNNAPLSLQLDHIDGDNKNNLMSNLRLLCPNCHSQTENFGSKNKTFKLHENSKIKDKVIFDGQTAQKIRVKFISDKEKRQSQAYRILENLKTSSIDFSKHGWTTPASKIIGIRHQHVARWMRMYAAEFYEEKCFQRSTLVKLTEQKKEENKEQRRKIKLNEYHEIKSLFENGLSHREIAQQYGVHHSSVQKILKTIDTQK